MIKVKQREAEIRGEERGKIIGEKKGKREGIREGKRERIRETRTEIARNKLKASMDPETVSKLCGLPLRSIQKLREQLGKGADAEKSSC